MKSLPDKWCQRWSCLASMLMVAVGIASAQTPAQLEIQLISGQPGLLVTGEDFSAHTILFTSEFANPSSWQVLTNIQLSSGALWLVDFSATNSLQRFYRAVANPTNMAFIPAGSFVMGDTLNDNPASAEHPTHTVHVSGLYMDRYEVTKALWDDVYNWAITHGYGFDFANSGQGKAANHPAHRMTWYDAVKWCNARSEKEGRTPAYYTNAAQTTVYRSGQVDISATWVNWNAGYRLPTEAEWEKAARGGAGGHRFAWTDADTITHNRANYYGTNIYAYDVNPTQGYHSTFNDTTTPYTSPVGYFAPNGYGLYDMTGNVGEWCWDWFLSTYYSFSPGSDPRGSPPTSSRVVRGGAWGRVADLGRAAYRGGNLPEIRSTFFGFRPVLPAAQP